MSDQANEQSLESRMMALLPEVEEQEPQTQEEPQESPEPQVEAEQETEAEAQPEPRKLKIKWNGEEVEKDENEVVELAQKGYDYTQKTQSLAEERKAIEAQAQAVKAQEQAFQAQTKLQQALISDIAKVTALDEQLAQYNNVDWQALSSQDPQQAQTLFFQYTQLKDKRVTLVNEVNQKHSYLNQQQQLKYQETLAKAQQELVRDIPGWNTEKAVEIRDIAKKYGASEDQLAKITDAWVVKALHDAAQFKKLQSSKPQVENKVAGKPPVVKPGSKDNSNSNQAQVKELRSQLRKSGKMDLAAALIERTL